jgi:hypothetical protein
MTALNIEANYVGVLVLLAGNPRSHFRNGGSAREDALQGSTLFLEAKSFAYLAWHQLDCACQRHQTCCEKRGSLHCCGLISWLLSESMRESQDIWGASSVADDDLKREGLELGGWEQGIVFDLRSGGDAQAYAIIGTKNGKAKGGMHK